MDLDPPFAESCLQGNAPLLRLVEEHLGIGDVIAQVHLGLGGEQSVGIADVGLQISGHLGEFQEQVRENIILAGGSAMINGLREALEGALSSVGGGKVRVVSNPDFAGSDGALAIALDALESDWEILTA